MRGILYAMKMVTSQRLILMMSNSDVHLSQTQDDYLPERIFTPCLAAHIDEV
jgi:hypothetical protein